MREQRWRERAASYCGYDECYEQACYLMAAQTCITHVVSRLKAHSRSAGHRAHLLFLRHAPICRRDRWTELRAILDRLAIEAVGEERWRAQLRRAAACLGTLADQLWREQLAQRRGLLRCPRRPKGDLGA